MAIRQASLPVHVRGRSGCASIHTLPSWTHWCALPHSQDSSPLVNWASSLLLQVRAREQFTVCTSVEEAARRPALMHLRYPRYNLSKVEEHFGSFSQRLLTVLSAPRVTVQLEPVPEQAPPRHPGRSQSRESPSGSPMR